MDTLGDLLVRADRSPDLTADHSRNVALRVHGDPVVEYSRTDFVTTAWKTASFFRHRGVHEGATVAIVEDPAAPVLLSFFGAVQLGAVVRFVPSPQDGTDQSPELDARLLVGPGECVLDYDLPPGATRITYTDDPDGIEDPTVEFFGRSVWSENPVAPPEEVAPDAPALATPDRSRVRTHEEVLATAARIAATTDLERGVAVRTPLSDPRTIAAGVVAPLLVGGTVVFPDVDDPSTEPVADLAGTEPVVDLAGTEPVADVAVTDGPAPEPETVTLSEVRGEE